MTSAHGRRSGPSRPRATGPRSHRGPAADYFWGVNRTLFQNWEPGYSAIVAATRQPIRAPELSELETFVLSLEEGSISRAAGRLRISTQAAAKRIRQLEVLAQTPLLVRGRRGVTATETGARLYPIALDLLAHRNRAVAALGGAPEVDPLRIAGMHKLFGRAPASRSEESFKNTEALLAAVFHATAEAVALIRPEDGLIHEINDAAVRLLGYEQGELRGRTAREINIWEDIGRRDECVQLAISTGEPQQAELVLRTRAGERLLAAVRFDAIELQDGVRVLVTSRKLRSLTSSAAAAVAVAGRPAVERLDKNLVACFSEALRAGVGKAALAAADAAIDAGAGIAALHTQLIEPAMRTIGELWECAEISVAEEHVATAICQEVAARIFFRALLDVPAARPGRVMMTAVQGEQHVLGLRLASDVLEAAGYDVLYLGADVPLDALVAACRIHRPEVLGLTATMWLNVPMMIWEINEVMQLEQPLRVMVGGRAVGRAIEQGLTAPMVTQSSQVLEIVEQLLAAPPSDGLVPPDLAARIPPVPPAGRPEL